MEIIHDLAPLAQLGFCAAETDIESVNCLSTLENNFQADIIVDDLAYYFDPYFEDGLLATRVQDLSDRLLYLMAAGNDAQGHYVANYVHKSVQGLSVHDFGIAAGGGSDHSMNVRVNPGGALIIFLQWNDPFGASGNDYDLYLLNQAETDVLCFTCFSTFGQNGF